MVRFLKAAAVAAVVGFSACSDGGLDDPIPSTVFSLSGTARAVAGTAVDLDTGDFASIRIPNDSYATAQPIPSAVTIGGWVSLSLDPRDVYRVALAGGRSVTLAISDPDLADLDLCLHPASDVDLGAPIDCQMGTGPVETLATPADDEYLVVVLAARGASSYLLTVGQPGPEASTAALSLAADFVPGEVVVRFREALLPASGGDGVSARAASVGLAAVAGGPRREMLLAFAGEEGRERAFANLGVAGPGPAWDGPSLGLLEREKMDTLRIVKALRGRPDVESADPNFVVRKGRTPNDGHYGFQWHYPLVGLPQAWDVTTGTPESGDVIVAVVDTGVFLAHPDLQSKLVVGYDFIRDAANARDGDGIDPDPDDPGDAATLGNSSWHGTHVAGTVGAASDNASPPFNGGVAGVSWGTRLMPVRVLGAYGGTSYDTLQGVRYAAGLTNDSGTFPARRADVVNLSLGCLGCFQAAAQAVYDEVRAAGVVVVASAGNENTSAPSYPAAYGGVLSVSAVDMNRARAPYSNFGPSVDIAAPGGDMTRDRDANGYGDGVLSTVADDSSGARTPVYAFYQGTSMAAPHVAGTVALMMAVCPSLSPAQVDSILASGGMTVDLGATGRDDVFGHGFLDALAAVQSAQTICGMPPAPTLDLTPTRLDFAPTEVELLLTVAKRGTGPLSVASVGAAAAWLSVVPVAVDAEGFGTYRASVDRASTAAGIHASSITFQAGAVAVSVPVTLQVGSATGAHGDVGRIYLLLLDASFRTIGYSTPASSGGAYAWSFPYVSVGSYFVVAGTDADDDGWICDPGEACGAYPTVNQPGPIAIFEVREGADFVVGYEATLWGAAAGRNPPAALEIPRPPKSVSRPR